MKNEVINYIVALDAFREDPVRVTKDAIFEAEYELRLLLKMPLTSMEVYGTAYTVDD